MLDRECAAGLLPRRKTFCLSREKGVAWYQDFGAIGKMGRPPYILLVGRSIALCAEQRSPGGARIPKRVAP